MAAIAAVHGDRAEQTGAVPGQLLFNQKPSLRGDVTIMVLDKPGVVLEAMDRDRGQLTPRAVKTELEEALKNRGARSAIAVVSTDDNTLLLKQPLMPLAPNLWAVRLDKDASDPTALKIAYRLARAATVAAMLERPTLDYETMKAGIEEINGKLTGLADAKQQLANIGRSRDVATAALEKVERETRGVVFQLLEALMTRGEAA